MNSKSKLLQSLIKIPSPSGNELKFVSFIRKYLLQFVPVKKMLIDTHYNLIVKIKGVSDQKSIMIDAHADTIGFLVNNVDKEGYISLISLGGHNKALLRGRHVTIITDKKYINGVIGLRPPHLIDDEDEENGVPNKIEEVTVDIGVRKRKQVRRYVKVGDYVVFKPIFTELLEDFYSGYGFDDKSGCFMLIETIKEIVKSKRKPPYDLYFTFSTQEELGCKGAKELVCRYKPNLYIGVDVTFATDVEEVDERDAGRCELGKGIVIYRGVNIDKTGEKKLLSISRRHKIKVQYQATNGIGFNADEVASMVGGLKILNIAIPLRNMHSSVEVVHMKDLNYGIKLLKHFLLSNNLKSVI